MTPSASQISVALPGGLDNMSSQCALAAQDGSSVLSAQTGQPLTFQLMSADGQTTQNWTLLTLADFLAGNAPSDGSFGTAIFECSEVLRALAQYQLQPDPVNGYLGSQPVENLAYIVSGTEGEQNMQVALVAASQPGS